MAAAVHQVSSYEPSFLAKFLHSFPHLDLTFKEVNSTFNPHDARYRESLVFWAALPILWLLSTLLLFLVYFCYRCCQRDVEKRQDVPCLRWSLAVLAMITLGALGVGFYGNEIVNNGALRFVASVEEASGTATNMEQQLSFQVNQLGEHINDTVHDGIEAFKRVNDNYRRDAAEERRVYGEVNQRTEDCLYYANMAFIDAAKVNRRVQKVNKEMMTDINPDYAEYRWYATLGLLSWMIFLCLLLLIGVGLSSKCTLLVFCAFGIFTLVLCWLAAGLHLGLSVAVGDLCVAPDVYFQKLAAQKTDRAVLKYYITCHPEDTNPFLNELKSARKYLDNANRTLHEAKTIAIDERNVRQTELDGPVRTVIAGLNDAAENLRRLSVIADCQVINKDYADGIEALCYSAVPGFAFLLLATVVVGLLYTGLVLLASKAWRHFTRGKGYPDSSAVEDEDTFFPRPDALSPSYIRYGSLPGQPNSIVHEDPSRAPPSSSYSSYSRGRHGHGREMQLQEIGSTVSTPPPAYNSNTFYRTGDHFMKQTSIPDDQSDYARETIA